MKFLVQLSVCFRLLLYSGLSIHAQTLFFNGTVYTVDSSFSKVNAVVVKEGRIVFAGDEKQARQKFTFTKEVNLQGRFMYPGFIDGHCHFYGYATDLDKCDLTGTKSWKEVLDKLQQHAKQHPDGWLFGRGWDQNDWKVKEFPTRYELDKLFPDRPVFLLRIDGHAALANKKALKMAGVNAEMKVGGGEIKLANVPGEGEWIDPHNRYEVGDANFPFPAPTGMLIDNAMDLVRKIIPETSAEKTATLLQQAQQNCFAVGLTTVSDAGLTKENIFLLDTLQKQDKLQMRVYAMVGDSTPSKEYFYSHGKYKTDFLNVCSFKYYADGALGSRGAKLKQPYNDVATSGFLLSSEEYFLAEAKKCLQHGFQMNTHCIGDSANALMLKVYGEVLKGKNDNRWRIEHCQVADSIDMPLFGKYSVIPSVQPTHATSDMYWAEDRLGKNRMKGAYAYKQLLQQNGMVANGSDFPVESINPLFGFYAAVARKDQKDFPATGFQKENALSREEALRGMTIWAAFANFEEKEKGSIEAGKFADFVILEKDIMQAPENELYKIKVLQTWLNGKMVFNSAH
ncbi:MAG: amidohydrolase [Chitinophagales bacterium]